MPNKGQNLFIAPSVMCAKPWEFLPYIRAFEKVRVGAVHFDVMDGHYAPNIMLGASEFDAIRSVTDLPLDVHLMCVEPEKFVAYFQLREGDRLSFHPEACRRPDELLRSLRARGIRAGYALSPAAPISSVAEALDALDFVMAMAVNPGFAGQTMVPDHLEKLRYLRAVLDMADRRIELTVDGNTSIENAREMLRAGATGLVAGSASLMREGPDSFVRLYRAYLEALSDVDVF